MTIKAQTDPEQSDSPRYSWTQPQCTTCWHNEHPGRQPVRLAEHERETCVTCGIWTEGGIYIRIDPSVAPYPTRLKD